MNIPVGAITISPTAAVAVTINQSSRYGVETSDTKHNATAYQTVKSADKSKSDAYIGITGKLGAGIALGDSLHSSINIGYDFTVNAYGKTYKDLSGEKHKVKGTYNITRDTLAENYNLAGSGKHITEHRFEADMTKKTYFSNTLKPSYSIQKDFTDRLSLFAGVECPITVELDTSVLTKESKTVTKTKHLNPAASHLNTTVTEVVTSPTQTMKKTTVEVKPAAMAAITYAAIPNRLSFNLGTKINFLNGKHVYTKVSKSGVVKTTRTTTVYDNQGNRTTVNDTPSEDNAKEYVKKGGTLYAIGAEVKGGLKWNITENFIFDFVYAHFLEAGRMLDPGAFKIACTVKF